jgi:hypothetical protein
MSMVKDLIACSVVSRTGKAKNLVQVGACTPPSLSDDQSISKRIERIADSDASSWLPPKGPSLYAGRPVEVVPA